VSASQADDRHIAGPERQEPRRRGVTGRRVFLVVVAISFIGVVVGASYVADAVADGPSHYLYASNLGANDAVLRVRWAETEAGGAADHAYLLPPGPMLTLFAQADHGQAAIELLRSTCEVVDHLDLRPTDAGWVVADASGTLEFVGSPFLEELEQAEEVTACLSH
jgi:hypothetical protein